MKKLVIFGTTSFARQAYAYLSYDSPYQISAFTVHQEYIQERKLFGMDVVPFEIIQETHTPEEFEMFVAIGYKKVNRVRAAIYNLCKEKGYKLISFINSKTGYWGHVEMGDNVLVYGNGVISPFTKIGNDCLIGSAIIAHEVNIGDHCFIAGSAMVSGKVKIGEYCFIGANATISDGVTIAPECIIGAGAIITKDTEKAGVYPGRRSEMARISSHELKSFQ